MARKGKRNFNLAKNPLINLLRSSLRIIFLIIFFHWILWITTYAKSTTYYEAINDEKIDKHDKKTEKYNSRGLLGGEHQEKNIGEIENDILEQIENKKALKKGDLPRKWGQEKLPNLETLQQEIKELEKKDPPTDQEKEELAKKRTDYQTKLKESKQETIDNIQTQLKKNDLNITELDDNRNWWQSLTHDPLKFFVVSPLNKCSKVMGLHNHLFLEIIFKLVIVEIILVWIYYSETIKVWENMEKMRDPYLSVEEKEQLTSETSPLVKYMFFNGFMFVLFSFFLFFHPAFFDRTSSLFRAGGSGTAWWIWAPLLFASFLLSNISNEFLHYGRLLNKTELKNYLVKNWVASLLFSLVMILIMRWVGMNSIGSYLFSLLGGLVKFIINTLRVKLFGHREHFPQRGTQNIR